MNWLKAFAIAVIILVSISVWFYWLITRETQTGFLTVLGVALLAILTAAIKYGLDWDSK